jgi:hypothetical protein
MLIFLNRVARAINAPKPNNLHDLTFRRARNFVFCQKITAVVRLSMTVGAKPFDIVGLCIIGMVPMQEIRWNGVETLLALARLLERHRLVVASEIGFVRLNNAAIAAKRT